MRQERERTISDLKKRYGVKSGSRLKFSKKKSWYLAVNERLAAKRIQEYLKGIKSCTIQDIYKLKELKLLWPNNEKRQFAVKYLIMTMVKLNYVTTKCNNGYKVIGYNRAWVRKARQKLTVT